MPPKTGEINHKKIKANEVLALIPVGPPVPLLERTRHATDVGYWQLPQACHGPATGKSAPRDFE